MGSGMAGVINATAKHFQLLLEDRPVDGRKITIEPRHFDRAISVPWSVATCLLAQAAIEAGFNWQHASVIETYSKEAKALRSAFDTEYAVMRRTDSPRMRWIREALPLTVIIPE